MAKTMIYPTAISYLSELALVSSSMAERGIDFDSSITKKIATVTNAMMAAVEKLSTAIGTHDFSTTDEHMGTSINS